MNDLREAVPGGHLSVGRRGYRLDFKQGTTNSGYDIEEMMAHCVAQGLPMIDTREIPFAILAMEVIRNPLVAVGEEPDPEPWSGLHKALLVAFARWYRDLGGSVFNVAFDDLPVSIGKGA